MSSFEIHKTENYRIEVEPNGRAGYIFYIEESRLPFDWEILGIKSGISISIPTMSSWNSYCEKNQAIWAKERRNEIVKKVAEAASKNWYKNGTYEFDQDRWLNIYSGVFFLSRWFNKLFSE